MLTELEKKLGKRPTGLSQSLKAGERGVELFHNSEFVGYENTYTPTTEEIDAEIKAEAREAAIQKITEKEEAAIRAKKKL